MEKKALFFKVCVILIFIILISGNLFSQTNPVKNKFSFGIVSELLRNWKYQTGFHFGNYSDLKLDIIQSYSNRGDWDDANEKCFGGFYNNIDSYKVAVDTSINYFQNAYKVFERAKIVRPAYGQRSTYQAENQECNYSCK